MYICLPGTGLHLLSRRDVVLLFYTLRDSSQSHGNFRTKEDADFVTLMQLLSDDDKTHGYNRPK